MFKIWPELEVPEDAVIAQDQQKVVSKEVMERVSDGENYDDVVAELEATNETLEANLLRDKDDLESEKLRLEEEIEGVEGIVEPEPAHVRVRPDALDPRQLLHLLNLRFHLHPSCTK